MGQGKTPQQMNDSENAIIFAILMIVSCFLAFLIYTII